MKNRDKVQKPEKTDLASIDMIMFLVVIVTICLIVWQRGTPWAEDTSIALGVCFLVVVFARMRSIRTMEAYFTSAVCVTSWIWLAVIL